jgi:hypothetical protein
MTGGGIEVSAQAAVAAARMLQEIAQAVDRLRDSSLPAITAQAACLNTGGQDAQDIKTGWYDAQAQNVADVLPALASNLDALATQAEHAVQTFQGNDQTFADLTNQLRT